MSRLRSEALNVIVIVPVNTASFWGWSIDTVGLVLSMVTLICVSALFPALSNPTSFKVCAPSIAYFVSQM